MRKPINNETQLINEIWNSKLLNEKQQTTEPSIYDPKMTNIMTDPASSVINKYLPWAERLGKAARGYKPRAAPETEGPTVSISDEDLESGEIPTIAIEPIIKKTPEFPGWGDAPHGYEPTTPEDAKAAEEWRNKNNATVAMQNLANRIADPTGMKAKQGEMSKVSTGQVSVEQPMDAAVDAFKKGAYKPATELGGIEGFAPALSASEFEELGMGVPKPSTAAPAPTTASTRIPIIPGSRGEIETILGIAREQPAPVPTTAKKTEEPSSFKLGPIASPDSGFGNRISAGAPKSIPSKSAEVEAKLNRTLERAEKLGAEEKAATPEQREKVEASAARLSKETGEKITPWSVKHSDAVNASIARNKAALEKARKEAEPKPTPVSAPVTRQEPTQQGRDASNIVPGSQMWGELSAAERQAVRDRYAKGEGPSISIRYNKETDRFDEPGYGDQGRYGDIVKALNMRESVNYYCNFITEMAKRQSKKSSKEPILPGIPATNKLEKPTVAEPAVQPDLFSSVSETKPVEAAPKRTRKSSKPKPETKPEPKVEVKPEPVSTPEPTVAEVKPVDATVTPTTSPVTPLKKAEPPMMSRTKAAGLGAAAGAVGTGLLATILAITSKGAPSPTTTPQQSQVSQPAPVNTENTPPFETPPETDQAPRLKSEPKSRIFRY
jgi:hypothetical protein